MEFSISIQYHSTRCSWVVDYRRLADLTNERAAADRGDSKGREERTQAVAAARSMHPLDPDRGDGTLQQPSHPPRRVQSRFTQRAPGSENILGIQVSSTQRNMVPSRPAGRFSFDPTPICVCASGTGGVRGVPPKAESAPLDEGDVAEAKNGRVSDDLFLEPLLVQIQVTERLGVSSENTAMMTTRRTSSRLTGSLSSRCARVRMVSGRARLSPQVDRCC